MTTALLLGAGSFAGVWSARRFDSPTIPRWAAVAAATLAAALVLFLLPSPQPVSVVAWTVVLVTLLASIAAIDAATQLIPDVLCLALVVTGLIQHPSLATGGLAICLIALALLQSRFGHNAWIGEGDLFLLAGILTWIGPLQLFDVALIAALIVTLQIIIFREKSQPLAPALGMASAAIWIGGPLI